jgi:hypothetical protein
VGGKVENVKRHEVGIFVAKSTHDLVRQKGLEGDEKGLKSRSHTVKRMQSQHPKL